MTHYCKHCGKQLLDDAIFCSYCGTQQESGREQPGDQWELCEIKLLEHILNCQFEAQAIGPKGMYLAGVSKKFPLTGSLAESKLRDKFLKFLVNELISEDWEPLGLGTHWYSYKFRRKVK